jgi:hypothetical protein
MKRFILACATILLPILAFGQANAPIAQTVRFTSSGPAAGPTIDTTTAAVGVYQFVFTWSNTGTVSAGAVKLQQSTDAAFTSPSDCIAAQTVTSSGGPTTITSCTAPYFRLLPSTAITGTGTVVVRVIGYPAQPPLSASISTTGLATSTIQTNSSQKTQVCDSMSNCAPVDATLGLKVQATLGSADAVDAGNSTTVALTTSGVFTGTGHSTLGFATIALAIDANVQSAASGVAVQWSEDNSNFSDIDTATFDATDVSNGQTFLFPVKRQYYRVVYTNGGTNQATFRLQTILKTGSPGGTVLDTGDSMSNAYHAQVVRNLPFGRVSNGAGTFNDAVIKNPSTAPTATDPSLVVAISPNSISPGVANANATTPAAVQLMASDNTNLQRIFTALTTTLGDGVNGNNELAMAGWVFNGTTWDRMPGTTNGVKVINGGTAFAVTANAGTNLNTSTLALESGGNLATLAGGVTSSKYQTNVAQFNGTAPYMQSAGVATLATAGSALTIDNFNYYGNGTPMLPTDVGTVAGGKTNNNAAPAATLIDTMTGLVNAVAPTYTEGFSAKSSLTPAGATRQDANSLLGTTLVPNPCATQTPIAFSVTTSAASQAIVTAVNLKKPYLCDFHLNTADAAGAFVTVIASTGTTGTTMHDVFVGSYANNATDGWFLAASGGGAVFEGGGVPAAWGSTAGDEIVIFTNGKKVNFSGHYVHQGFFDPFDWRFWISACALALYRRRRRAEV